MTSLSIEGGKGLAGEIEAEGAKNAALPACAASLLTDEPVVLRRVPHLRDVSTILAIIGSLGKRVLYDGHTALVTSSDSLKGEAEAYYVEQMRASFLVLGPLVARLGHAVIPLPGGCTIGPRPIDLHLRGLRQLGATIEERFDRVVVQAERLRGARIELAYPSVGATEQLLMTSVLADGETQILNPAQEPEVMDLIQLLRKMGAEIEVAPSAFRIVGVDKLHGAEHAIIPDRMEAGTYLLAAAITMGEIAVRDVLPAHLRSLLSVLQHAGMDLSEEDESIHLTASSRPRPIQVTTGPYPGFPTDLHPPLVSFLTLAEGESRLEEGVFEQRFGYAPHLKRLGASIEVVGPRAVIRGVRHLRGAVVSAPDIRAGAALVLAGLAATGTTVVDHVERIDRGYSRIEDKLRHLGACIERHT